MNEDDTEMIDLLEPHSSIYRMVVPLAPKVMLVGWVKRMDVSEGIIMMWADWMNIRDKV